MAASLLSSGAELQFGDLTSSNLNEPMQAMPSTTASTASPLRNRKVFVGLTVAAVAATTAVVIAKPDLTSVFAFLMEHWVGLFTAIGSIAQATLVVGLWQAKKQYQLGVEQANQTLRLSKISARRDAICLAAELCNHFGKDLTDQISKLEQIFAHGKSPVLSRAKVTTSDGIINLDLGAMTDVDRQFCKKNSREITILLNSIEGFAIPFATSVADDQVGYIECGRTFVQTFERLLPLYYITDPSKELYQASQTLYWRWAKRRTSEQKAKKVQELKQQITMEESQIDPKAMQSQSPLGC